MIKYLSFHLHIRATYHPRSINFFLDSLFAFNYCTFSLHTDWLINAYTYKFKGKKVKEKRKNRL